MLSIQIVFLPLAGIDGDESLFAQPFLRGIEPLYSFHFGGARIPVMSLSYVGALKSWIYWPVFRLWGPGIWAVRLPVCLIAVATVMVLGGAIRRFAGSSTAVLTILFLAFDPLFIVTNVYDWGPVALLLFSTAVVLACLCRFGDTGRSAYLWGAFLAAGIATWYKTIFLALFVSMLFALAVVYFRKIRELVTWPGTLGAAIAFLIGSLPLIVFNITQGGATVRAGAEIPAAPIHEKLLMMLRTLDGRALEHYMFRSSAREIIPLSGASLADLVTGWYRTTAMGPGSAMPVLLLLSLAALPFLRRSSLFRPLLCGWIACGAFFALMLGFRDAGAGPHHTVLLDPGPQFIVAATGVAAWRFLPRAGRLVPAIAACLLVVSDLHLVSRYFAEAKQNGFSELWSASTNTLSRTIQSQNRPVAFLDWGIRETVGVESGDRFPLASDAMANETSLYATHCPDYILDPSRTQTFERNLHNSGLERTAETIVHDGHGQPIYCLFVLHKPDQ